MKSRPALIALLILLASVVAFAQGTRAAISGTVTNVAGQPQTGVVIWLTNLADNSDRRGTSDVNGAFVFGGLQPGAYRLRTEDAQFAPWSRERIEVAAGERAVIAIPLQPRVQIIPAAVFGTLIGPDGRPRAGVAVVLTNTATGAQQQVTSDRAGSYAFRNLDAGGYRLATSQPDAKPESIELTIRSGEQFSADLRLQPLPPPPPPPPLPPAPTPVPPSPPAAREPQPLPAVESAASPNFEAMPDRWHQKFAAYQRYDPPRRVPWVVGHPLDPYNQNPAKADFPIGNGRTFVNLNLQFNSQLNPRQAANGQAPESNQLFYNQNAVVGAEVFNGDTVFQPKNWAVRVTAVNNLNALADGSFSFSALSRKPLSSKIEELFGEKRLAVLNPAFDFVSIRAGMQNFNSDFRGYLFVDNQLGVRIFGNARGNRDQYNVAVFSMRQRDQTQLHAIQTSTGQQVFIANYFVQDFGTAGYTAMFNVHLNHDPRGSGRGPGQVSATYIGFHGDGRWGGWSVSHAFYEVLGHDTGNARAVGQDTGPSLKVNAQMAAIEVSRDSDWRRFRTSFLWASGDKGQNGQAGGFDMITDNPNLAGGQFMYWTQQTIKVPGVGLLKDKFSLIPSLRDKFSAGIGTPRSNFLNPGLILINGGMDVRLSPQLKVVTNASYLRFADVSTLVALVSRSQSGATRGAFSDSQIGFDLGTGAKYRPFVNENLFVNIGAAALVARGGFANALGSSRPLYSLFGTVQIAY